MLSLVIAAFVGSGALTYAATASLSFSTTIEAGSMVETASYVVFKDGSTYFSKNGTTGAIDYSGTNATTIISNALTYASEKVFLKSATYVIDGLTIPNGKTLEGEGWNTILYLRDSADDHVIANSGTVGYGNITIRNLKIDGNAAGQTANVSGISFQNISRYLIEKVWITNTNYYGIHIGVQANKTSLPDRTGRAHPCGIRGGIIEKSGSDGILLGNTGAGAVGDVENFHVFGVLLRENGDNGIRVVDCGGVGVGFCTIYNNTENGIYYYISGMGQIIGNSISSNGKHGIRLEASNKASVVGNGINWNNYSGIHLYDSEFDSITGGSIEYSGQHGIHLKGSSNNTITGVTLIHNGRLGLGHGIFVQNNTVSGTFSLYNTISTCGIFDDIGVAVTQDDGLLFDVSSDYNIAVAIQAWGNEDIQIHDLGSNNEIHSSYNGTSWIT